MKVNIKIVSFFVCLIFHFGVAQSRFDSFLQPSDSLHTSRRNTVVISEASVCAVTLIGLNQLWYADYPKSNFHFVDDSNEWLQMDKVGHFYSSYHMGSFGAQALRWSGCSKKSQLIYGATLGFAFLSAVEVLDGYSSQWGASPGDILANATGTACYISQELLWKEQRIVPKFSFHTTVYPAARPNVLGTSLPQQVLKDYNGQTYWLSVNLHSFFKQSKIPKWLNLAVGYGAEGMITGKEELVNTIFFPTPKRTRQFYFSLDADLTKIRTKSPLLKTFFSIFNTVKIPAPTIEISNSAGVKWRSFYF